MVIVILFKLNIYLLYLLEKMKKFTLIFALVFSLFLFVGCSKSNGTENVNEWNDISWETSVETNIEKDENIKSNWWDIVELYKNWWKLTCKMEAVEEELWKVFATLYVDGDKSFIETSFTLEWQDMNLYALTRDGKTYTWWDMYWDWFGLVVVAENTIEEQLADYDAEDEDIEMECESGVKWANFDVPSDIEFSDLSDLYQ